MLFVRQPSRRASNYLGLTTEEVVPPSSIMKRKLQIVDGNEFVVIPVQIEDRVLPRCRLVMR